jgi:DnaK suppressor protein
MGVTVSKELMMECRTKLLRMKDELLNRSRMHQQEFASFEKGSGDEIDQTVAQIAEDHFLLAADRMRKQLSEIEWALARIQAGEFGVCEETQEPIEMERLMAIPYTRLSIEGAEIREAMQRRTSSI